MPTVRPELLPESGESLVGAVGNLVSAALQTAGFYFQSDILQFGGGFLTALAVLIFVAGCVWGAFQFTIKASMLRTAPLLIGCVLFFFTVRTVVETGPTKLQAGARTSTTAASEQMQLLRQIGNPDFYGTKPKVSFLFAQLDRVISSAVQKVVMFLVDTRNMDDLLVVAREETLAKLFNTAVIEKDFLELISYGVMGQCAELTNRITEKESLERQLAKQRAWNQPTAVGTVNKISEVTKRINLLKETRFNVPEAIGRFVFSRGLTAEAPQSAICDDVYEWTWKSMQQLAEQRLREATTPEGNDSAIPWTRVNDDIRSVISAQRPDMAPRVLAAYLFKKTLQEGQHSGMLSTLMEHSPIRQNDFDIRFKVLPITDGQGSMMTMMHFIGIVPYVQGLLLFLLSAAFPFFALFLLVPGKMSSFLVWISLWIWVKSWDIGFAVIVSVRKLLWAMIGQKSVPLLEGESLNDLTSAFSVLGDFDPLANIGVYYTIIAMLTMAVPILSAHLCNGASNMLGAFRAALDESASRLHNRAAHGARRAYASMFEQRFYVAQQEHGLSKARQYANSQEARERGVSGDGLKARSVQGAYDKARTHGRYSDKLINESADLGYFSRRSVTQSFSSTVSGASLSSWSNDKLHQMGESPNIKELPSAGVLAGGENRQGVANNNLNNSNPDKNKQSSNVSGGDGGDGN